MKTSVDKEAEKAAIEFLKKELDLADEHHLDMTIEYRLFNSQRILLLFDSILKLIREEIAKNDSK